jgi:predicted DNA-binding transcriptional regulator YafY
VPIEGEAGIGYRLGTGFELPPLMFTQDEARALAAAARLAQSWLDPGMAADVESALGKILSVLPPSARTAAEALALFAPPVAMDAATRERLQTLREAVQSRHKLQLDYRDVHEAPTRRIVRPLGCFYWGRVWTLAAWCELREDVRSFRVDRMAVVQVQGERFADEPGKTLADLLRRLRERKPEPPGEAN